MPLDKNLKNLKILLSAMEEDHLTKADFVQHFEKVVNLIKKMQTRNEDEMVKMCELHKKLKETILSQNEKDFNSLKEIILADIEKQSEKLETIVSTFNLRLSALEDKEEVDEDDIIRRAVESVEFPVRDKLESLSGDQRIQKDAIKGLSEDLKDLRELIVKTTRSKAVSGPNINALQYADLSSQCNGSNKSFQVPRHRTVVLLVSTQSPIVYKPTTDFTTANVTLTLTDAVTAPASGQTLIFLYVK